MPTMQAACHCDCTSLHAYQFTSKERDSESGLDMFGARYYGSSLGRFMTPDWAAKPADRFLPVIPDVYRMLKARHEAQDKPAVGWLFPSTAKCGHLEQGTGKTQHSAALAKANAETLRGNAKLEAAGEKPLPLPLPPFEPYVMRHTALTRMAPFCDAFTLASIAGHSSITITQRYCHPQADAVEAALSKFGNRSEVVTDGGHNENRQLAERSDAQTEAGA